MKTVIIDLSITNFQEKRCCRCCLAVMFLGLGSWCAVKNLRVRHARKMRVTALCNSPLGISLTPFWKQPRSLYISRAITTLPRMEGKNVSLHGLLYKILLWYFPFCFLGPANKLSSLKFSKETNGKDKVFSFSLRARIILSANKIAGSCKELSVSCDDTAFQFLEWNAKLICKKLKKWLVKNDTKCTSWREKLDSVN